MAEYTGYREANSLLNELEELKISARLRANDLQLNDITRTRADEAANAYSYCQLRLIYYFGGIHNENS